mmetsp:Transcript_15676/g.28052  ORF Transcript_15676/g.28052 Transcript_15676/m.28052 type:complete len:132 (-) Transcript_15676:576-971(-)
MDDGEEKREGIVASKSLGESRATFDSKKTNRILLIGSQVCKKGHKLPTNKLTLNSFGKPTQLLSSSTTDHRSLIMAKFVIELSKLSLYMKSTARISSRKKSTSRNTGREPTFNAAQSLNNWYKVFTNTVIG